MNTLLALCLAACCANSDVTLAVTTTDERVTFTADDPCPLQEPTTRVQDRWIAPDKFMHLTMSFGVTAFSFGAVQAAGLGKSEREVFAAAVGALAGTAKEIWDVRRGQHFSLKDLVWDGAGIGLALLVLRHAR